MTRPLVIAPCRDRCRWRGSDVRLDGEQVFACAGCGSEWVASQPWTPADRTGTVPAQVAEARRGRGRG